MSQAALCFKNLQQARVCLVQATICWITFGHLGKRHPSMGIWLTPTNFRQARSLLPSGSSNYWSLLSYTIFVFCLWLSQLSSKTTTANQSLRSFEVSWPTIGRWNQWTLHTMKLGTLLLTPAPSLLPSTHPVQVLSSQSNSRCLRAHLQDQLVHSFGNHSTGQSTHCVLVRITTSSIWRAKNDCYQTRTCRCINIPQHQNYVLFASRQSGLFHLCWYISTISRQSLSTLWVLPKP
jgi:hypothetical protein